MKASLAAPSNPDAYLGKNPFLEVVALLDQIGKGRAHKEAKGAGRLRHLGNSNKGSVKSSSTRTGIKVSSFYIVPDWKRTYLAGSNKRKINSARPILNIFP